MSLYILVWLFLCALSVKEAAVSEKTSKPTLAFWGGFLIMTIMLVFRYGQGTDYFGYRYNYYKIPDFAITFPEYDVHGEMGYNLLCNIFRVFHLPFECFVAFISVIQMAAMLAFYKRYQIATPFALLLSMPTLYMTYFMSGIRQGLVIAVFLGILLPMLESKNYVGYVIGTLVCISIHSVAIVFLLMPVVQMFCKVSYLQVLVALSWLGGLILATPEGQTLVKSFGISGLNFYLEQTSISLASSAERLMLLGIVTWLYIKLEKYGKCNNTFRLAYSGYLLSMMIYGGLLWNSLVASRTAAALRFLEIYLVVYGVRQMNRGSRYLAVIALLVLQTFMLFKNVTAAIQQGNYTAEIRMLDYPYVSVFTQDEIFSLRKIPNKYINIS